MSAYPGRNTRCPDCEHINRQCDCTCVNARCICCKRNRDQWNGLSQVNGGFGFTGVNDRDVPRRRIG